MNELEQYLSEFGLYADVWTDDEGLHVHDWDTDECSVFAHESILKKFANTLSHPVTR